MFDSPWHWAVVAIVAFVLFFGWKQLPDMARSLGRSLRIFKTEIKGMSEDDKAREATKSEPQALEAPVAEPPASVPEPPKARPRPAPTPNGRAQAESTAKSD
jgi:sec-independent protein translocase protein TatA